MEEMIATFIGKLLEHGAWGFLVAWLMYSNLLLNKKLDASGASMEAMLLRHAEQREKSAEVMTASAAAMIKVSEAVKILSDQVDGLRDVVVGVTAVATTMGERLSTLQTMLLNDINSKRGRRV